MADREKLENSAPKRKKSQSHRDLDATLFGVISQEYAKLDKKKRTVDDLYSLMMKKDLLAGVSKGEFEVYFKAIAEKGFTVDELQSPKMQEIHKHIGTSKSEEQIINNCLKGMQQSLQDEPGVFSAFVDEYKFRTQGKSTVVTESSRCRSLTQLQDAWEVFQKKKKVD